MEFRKVEKNEKEELLGEEKEPEKEDSKEKESKTDNHLNSVQIQNLSLRNQKQKNEEKKAPNNYKIQNTYQTGKKEKEEFQNEIQTNEKKETTEIQEPVLEPTSTYILKYTRKGDELKEISEETGLRKSENCLFMLNIKLVKSDSISIIDPLEETKEQETPRGPENFLVFCCHEIAAIYFDEIYERIFTLNDLANENKYFKVFESTEEAKMIIDETIRNNEKNEKKIFIGFKNKELKLHMKLSFFDKEKEIVLNIPKKPLSDEDKANLLPEFLKEIQDKMNHLNEENKKLKLRKTSFTNSRKKSKSNYNNKNIDLNKTIDIAKVKKDKVNNEISSERINNKNNKNNINSNSANNSKHKKVKKLKVFKKKLSKNEENFF